MPNYDPDSGIAYGVVALNSLEDWVYDEFFHDGRNLTMEAIEQDALAENGWDELPDGFWDDVYTEEEEYRLEADGMILELSYLGGAPLVWVLKSPHTAEVRQCSPCCPGAGDLDAKVEGGMVCYDVPADWYYQPEEISSEIA